MGIEGVELRPRSGKSHFSPEKKPSKSEKKANEAAVVALAPKPEAPKRMSCCVKSSATVAVAALVATLVTYWPQMMDYFNPQPKGWF